MRTKRILLAKIGTDETGTNSISSSVTNYEENTLIAALCDLIERIWSHARSDDYDGKCPLWSHLTAFHNFHQETERENNSYTNKKYSEPIAGEVSSDTWTSLKKRIDCNKLITYFNCSIQFVYCFSS